jgi:hypothetical protein
VADGGAYRLGGIPAALGTRAAAAADEIERHPLLSTPKRGLPTSLHIATTVAAKVTLQGFVGPRTAASASVVV